MPNVPPFQPDQRSWRERERKDKSRYYDYISQPTLTEAAYKHMNQTSCVKETNTKLIATVVCNQEVDESAAAAAPPSITQGQHQGQPLAAPNASVPVDTASPAVTPNMEGTTSRSFGPGHATN